MKRFRGLVFVLMSLLLIVSFVACSEEPTDADTEDPTVFVTAPGDNSVIVATTSYTVSGLSTDNVGVASVLVIINGGAPLTATGTDSWSCPVVLNAGVNSISVYATDAAGNTSESVSRTISVDASAVSVEILSPANNYITNGSSVTVSGTASISNHDIVGISYNINGGAYSDITGFTIVGGVANWSTSVALTVASNQITVQAVSENNKTNSSTVYIRHDAIGPTVSITAPTLPVTMCLATNASEFYNMTVSYSDNMGTVTNIVMEIRTNSGGIAIDTNSFVVTTSPQILNIDKPQNNPGTYIVQFYGVDNLGNKGALSGELSCTFTNIVIPHNIDVSISGSPIANGYTSDFGGLLVDVAYESTYIYLSNASTSNISIASVSIDSSLPWVMYTNSLVYSLAPGAVTSFYVRLYPLAEYVGNKSCVVHISNTSSNNPDFIINFSVEIIAPTMVYFWKPESWSGFADPKITYWGGSDSYSGTNVFMKPLSDRWYYYPVAATNNWKMLYITNTLDGTTSKVFARTNESWLVLDAAPDGWYDTKPDAQAPDAVGGFTVHFKKPDSWATNINIHYWGGASGGTSWPGLTMTPVTNDWYSYTFPAGTNSSVIFNDGSSQTADLVRTNEGWYTLEQYPLGGTWTDTKPF